MSARTVAALLVLVVAGGAQARPKRPAAPTGPSPIAEARQLVLVVAPGWDATSATLQRYARSSERSGWRAVGGRVPVVLGKGGLAWGKGLHGAAPAPPVKREGDGRSPAGAFRLSGAFGYAPAPPKGARLPYVTVTKEIECVDDPSSSHYNAIVDKTRVRPQDWTSSEHMLRADGLYRLGVVVEHNPPPSVASAGSCIFLHIAREGSTTVGCTAMAPERLEEILGWLDPAASPALVQLPEPDRKRLRTAWRLP